MYVYTLLHMLFINIFAITAIIWCVYSNILVSSISFRYIQASVYIYYRTLLVTGHNCSSHYYSHIYIHIWTLVIWTIFRIVYMTFSHIYFIINMTLVIPLIKSYVFTSACVCTLIEKPSKRHRSDSDETYCQGCLLYTGSLAL